MSTITCGLPGKVGLRDHGRQLQLHHAETTPFGSFVQSAKSAHFVAPYLVMDSSPGAPFRDRCLGEVLAIMIKRVRM
jgi:hypothetical protein